MINSLGAPFPTSSFYASRHHTLNAYGAKSRFGAVQEDEQRKPRPQQPSPEEDDEQVADSVVAQSDAPRYESALPAAAKLAALESEMDDLLTSILAHRI